MIRYSCDLCRRELDPTDDVRYVVKIDVSAALDPQDCDESDDDRDHLQEINELLHHLDSADHEASIEAPSQQLRFDLCPNCRRKFLKKPLGNEHFSQFDFSEN